MYGFAGVAKSIFLPWFVFFHWFFALFTHAPIVPVWIVMGKQPT
jgi:hypothetical protein